MAPCKLHDHSGGLIRRSKSFLSPVPQQHQHEPVHRTGHGAGDDHRPGDGEHLHHRPRDEALGLCQDKTFSASFVIWEETIRVRWPPPSFVSVTKREKPGIHNERWDKNIPTRKVECRRINRKRQAAIAEELLGKGVPVAKDVLRCKQSAHL